MTKPTDLSEAKAILAGTSMMLCEKRHLEALEEYYDVALVRLFGQIDELRKGVLKI